MWCEDSPQPPDAVLALPAGALQHLRGYSQMSHHSLLQGLRQISRPSISVGKSCSI